ncbi:putative pre-mRNA-splicing factor ATP-dependent RNA helicase DHX16 [Chenopodium quinoa]|uniref:putative pre-mRNA-splicing factor ATP-dependent RNA helicase DHX16 n=1 Tax=Chenopodium quinoa TaxID=63459 RepID=UPI000B78FEA4|nr:putative pre-mRNA-splicing factor ATP-dependent RNA helicase DHX16 [Chenopodium quinoa]
MQGQNEAKSEGGVTNIQEEEITYVRKRKVENVEAEVIDRSEFEKHIESKSVAIRHRKLPTRLQPPRKLQKKEGREKEQEEGKDQKEEEGNNVEDDDKNNDSKDDGEDDNKGDVKMKEKDEKEEMEDDSEEEQKIDKKNQTQKKKRKIEKEEDGEDVQVVEANEQDKLVKRQPYQRVPPTQFMKDVLINLSEKQKQAIRNIGFGGFLELDLPIHINSTLTENLVTNFDTERCCLMLPKRKQEIFLEAIDVHLAYGLPLGGKRIEQPNDESNLKWSKFLKAWRSKFGLKKGSPTNKRLIDRIQELKKEKSVSDEFLWNFVVCVVNCCIRSTNNPQLYIKFLYSCMDVKKIAELDWCTFVIEHLKDSVSVWKKGNSYFTGPLPFLMVFYFDRLQRGGLEKPRKCPLISVWTKERIQVRYKFEKDHGFGYGKLLERIESIVV